MRVIQCEQGSPEWHRARLGVPTASQFSRIVTPKTMKLSASADKYICELLAEVVCGESDDYLDDRPMIRRGSDMEEQAVRFYEFTRGVDTEKVGFCMHDTLHCGASPDRLVGEDEGLEIKVPSAANHVAMLLGMKPDEYKAQVQGNLWVTGRRRWTLLAWHPTMPPALTTYERDEAYIGALEAAMSEFLPRLEQYRERLERIRGKVHAA